MNHLWKTKKEFSDAVEWLRSNAPAFAKRIASGFVHFDIKWGDGDKAHIPGEPEILLALQELIDAVAKGGGQVIQRTCENLSVMACPTGEKRIVQASISFSVGIHTWIERTEPAEFTED